MSRYLVQTVVIVAALAVGAATVQAGRQGPPAGAGHGQGQGQGGGHGHGQGMGHGMRNDPAHAADMDVFHFLLDNGSKIRRTVTERPDGVETLTESDDPAVAEKIKAHVDSMYTRVENRRPIHQRDPLFREVFAHADKIVMAKEPTAKGVKVVETSADPYVAKLIKAHAEVVSKFIANGRREAMTNHEVPAR